MSPQCQLLTKFNMVPSGGGPLCESGSIIMEQTKRRAGLELKGNKLITGIIYKDRSYKPCFLTSFSIMSNSGNQLLLPTLPFWIFFFFFKKQSNCDSPFFNVSCLVSSYRKFNGVRPSSALGITLSAGKKAGRKPMSDWPVNSEVESLPVPHFV